MTRPLPTGTVTFLLTDVEDSTRLWETRRDDMGPAIARHYEILDAAVARAGGQRPVEQGEGDSIVAVFTSAPDALDAATAARQQLAGELPWLRVRMAVHTGETQRRDEGNYVGATIIRCARLRACAHGGQIVVSDITASLVSDRMPDGTSLRDLGTVRLKGMDRPERVWQLDQDGTTTTFPALRSLAATPTNLPAATTRLIGRGDELGMVGHLLDEHGLVTLTGSGGAGKTRLAQEVARHLLDDTPGGVWWIDLAPLTSGTQVAAHTAAAIGVGGSGHSDPTDDIVSFLRSQGGVLLLLDNAEHVVADVARLVDAVRRSTPETRLVVTSREPLGIGGESIFRVPSLRTPPLDPAPEAPPLESYPAAALFLERARQARPNLVVDERASKSVAAICHRLDGIPLALELAASRARSMPLDRLARELDDAFRVLTGGSRTALERQQTLLASILWSYDRLDEAERAVLRRLSVFHGAFALDAAEGVVTDDDLVDRFTVLDTLASLVDKSLVVFDERKDAYRLLEVVRQFGVDQLRQAGELLHTRARHCRWWVEWCERDEFDNASLAIDGSELWIPDMLAALDWAYDNAPDEASRLTSALAWARTGMGYTAEMIRQYRWVLNNDETDRGLWARAVAGMATTALALADTDYPVVAARAMPHLRTDDRRSHALLATYQATQTVFGRGDEAPMVALADEARASGDSSTLRIALSSLAVHYVREGRVAKFEAVIEDMERMLRSHGLAFAPATAGGAFGSLANLRYEQGRFAETTALVRTAGLAHPMNTTITNGITALLARATGDADLLAYAAARHRADGPPLLIGGRRLVEALLADGTGDAERARASVLEAFDAFPSTLPSRSFILQFAAVLLLRADQRSPVKDRLAMTEAVMPTVDPPPLAVAHLHQVRALLDRHGGRSFADDAAGVLRTAHEHGFALLTVDGLELVAEQAADDARAATIFAAATSTRRHIGYTARSVPDQQSVDALVERLRVEEPDAWAEGERLSLDDAVEYALRGRGERGRPSHGWGSLTPTETRVVELVAEGLSNDDVARRLLMSPATVKTHLTHVYAKTATTNRTELSARWRDR